MRICFLFYDCKEFHASSCLGWNKLVWSTSFQSTWILYGNEFWNFLTFCVTCTQESGVGCHPFPTSNIFSYKHAHTYLYKTLYNLYFYCSYNDQWITIIFPFLKKKCFLWIRHTASTKDNRLDCEHEKVDGNACSSVL